jgi:hypothetical protein
MGLVAALLSQNVLKSNPSPLLPLANRLRFLLKFGEVAPYVGYNALKNFFPSTVMKPNPSCSNAHCVQRQGEYQVRGGGAF